MKISQLLVFVLFIYLFRQGCISCQHAINVKGKPVWSVDTRPEAQQPQPEEPAFSEAERIQMQAYMDSCTKVLTADPNNLMALLARGEMACKLERYDEARTDIDRALQMAHDPMTAAQAHHIKGRYFMFTNQQQQARAAFRQALQLDPTSAPTHYSRGCMLAESGDYIGALRDMDSTIRLDSNFYYAYVATVKLYADMGEKEKAAHVETLNSYKWALKTFEVAENRFPTMRNMPDMVEWKAFLQAQIQEQ